jgi:hypothetical protein
VPRGLAISRLCAIRIRSTLAFKGLPVESDRATEGGGGGGNRLPFTFMAIDADS